MLKKKTIVDFYNMKSKGEKVAWITAYDAPIAALAEASGLDMLLVGDSLGMCVCGYDGTVPAPYTGCPHWCSQYFCHRRYALPLVSGFGGGGGTQCWPLSEGSRGGCHQARGWGACRPPDQGHRRRRYRGLWSHWPHAAVQWTDGWVQSPGTYGGIGALGNPGCSGRTGGRCSLPAGGRRHAGGYTPDPRTPAHPSLFDRCRSRGGWSIVDRLRPAGDIPGLYAPFCQEIRSPVR